MTGPHSSIVLYEVMLGNIPIIPQIRQSSTVINPSCTNGRFVVTAQKYFEGLRGTISYSSI